MCVVQYLHVWKCLNSFIFAQRKKTIADETHFCDPEILAKILNNKVRVVVSSLCPNAPLLAFVF